MPRVSKTIGCRSPIPRVELFHALGKLTSAEARKELLRIHASAALAHSAEVHDEVAEVAALEEAAHDAMRRLSAGTSTDVDSDAALADQWASRHAARLAAEALQEARVAAVVAELLSDMARAESHAASGATSAEAEEAKEAVEQAAGEGEAVAAECLLSRTLAPADLDPDEVAEAAASATGSVEENATVTPHWSDHHDAVIDVLDGRKSIVSDTLNSADTNKLNRVNTGSKSFSLSGNSHQHAYDHQEPTEEEEEEEQGRSDVEEKGNALPIEQGEPVALQHASSSPFSSLHAVALDSSGRSQDNTEANQPTRRVKRGGLVFPQLSPPLMESEVTSSTAAAAPAPAAPAQLPTVLKEPPQEREPQAAPPHPPKRLCFEDYDLRFTQADFDDACAELRQSRGGAAEAASAAVADRLPHRPAALLALAGAKLVAERSSPPPPPRHVEDGGLHYIRRQLCVRHLQPYVSPLKALTLRLAEGDADAPPALAFAAQDGDEDAAPQLSDPLMRRLAAELEEVCERRPVPRVRVRPDAQVFRRRRGGFKAEEARVQLHVEVMPVSGPMAGASVHVWVRMPAGYPFVAPRAHLTVEVPHRRCTGVAVDKVPHLIALSYEHATPDARDVCPEPPHAGEVAQLRPLHGAMNCGWRLGLTLRHVLLALVDLFNADEFAETARELQNENMMHSGMQRARVNMYEEENAAAWEATAAAAAAAAASRGRRSRSASGLRLSARNTGSSSSSNEDNEESVGEDSMGVTTVADDDVSPSYVLLCNGPFISKPPAVPVTAGSSSSGAGGSPATGAAAAGKTLLLPLTSPTVDVSSEVSFLRGPEVDGDDEEGGSPTTPLSTPSRRNAASRRRQRRPLMYNEMDSHKLAGPWRGCWGHVLYSATAAATSKSAVVTPAVGATSPSHIAFQSASSERGEREERDGPATLTSSSPPPTVEMTGAFDTASPVPATPPPKQAPQSLMCAALPQSPARREAEGVLYVKLTHHVATAPAATVRLVHVPVSVLREQGTASVASTPLRRSRGRLSPQSTWVTAALAAAPSPSSILAAHTPAAPVTAWTSRAPAEVSEDVWICIRDADRAVDDPAELSTTQCPSCQRQHVNLRDLREASAAVSCAASSANVAVPPPPPPPQSPASPLGAETNSTQASEATTREEECAQERCYAVVVDVPEGQEVSVVFSSDEEACRAVTYDGTATEAAQVNAVAAAAAGCCDDVSDASATAVAHRGVLVELPYDEWQFQTASGASAAALGARRDEDVHPHWPRAARFHGGHRVVPVSLKEAAFRSYQLLQNMQMATRSNAQAAASYLAAAPHARVRQVYAAARATRDHEAMVRRYGFWGWRNLLLPLLSPDTQELVMAALQAGASPGRSARSLTSARMLSTALSGWERAALESFGAACVLLHRDPDASLAYRPPFRSFAVLRTLALTAAYALEVMEAAQHAKAAGAVAGAEQPALMERLRTVLCGATVVAVATAAVRPPFLEVCLALVDSVKMDGERQQGEGEEKESREAEAATVAVQHCRREVALALSQLSPLQRSVAQVLAASTVSAFPQEVAALMQGGSVSANGCVDSAATLSDRVAELLNAPSTPLRGNIAVAELTAASVVSAFTNLIATV